MLALLFLFGIIFPINTLNYHPRAYRHASVSVAPSVFASTRAYTTKAPSTLFKPLTTTVNTLIVASQNYVQRVIDFIQRVISFLRRSRGVQTINPSPSAPSIDFKAYISNLVIENETIKPRPPPPPNDIAPIPLASQKQAPEISSTRNLTLDRENTLRILNDIKLLRGEQMIPSAPTPMTMSEIVQASTATTMSTPRKPNTVRLVHSDTPAGLSSVSAPVDVGSSRDSIFSPFLPRFRPSNPPSTPVIVEDPVPPTLVCMDTISLVSAPNVTLAKNTSEANITTIETIEPVFATPIIKPLVTDSDAKYCGTWQLTERRFINGSRYLVLLAYGLDSLLTV